MKTIPLTKGKVALVDDYDFEWLNKYKWCVHGGRNGKFYATRKENGQCFVEMHRMIMQATPEVEIDHINGNSLDNQRHNLRACTHAENCRNRKTQLNTTSQYKGVAWHKKTKKWCAYIRHNYKLLHLGNFHKEIDAAKAYDTKAIELFGEFAQTNLGVSL